MRCSHKRSHNCSHIAEKRGVFYYRRRLPAPHTGDLALSLRTRDYRAAVRLSRLLNAAFETVCMSTPVTRPDLAAILRSYLSEQLEEDRSRHLTAKAGQPVYALKGTYDALQVTPQMADRDILAFHRSRYADAIADRDIREVARHTDHLMKENDLSGEETASNLVSAFSKSFTISQRFNCGGSMATLPLRL